MVRSAFFSAVVVSACVTGQTAVAQPPKPPRLKLVSVTDRMSKPVKFKYEKTPLKELVEDLKEQLKVPIVIETKVLEEAAINLEFPISGESQAGPALESVNGIFNPLGLAAEIRHDVLFVSTIHAQSQWLVSRCYRLKPGSEADGLMKQISSQIGVESWDSVGGPGSIVKVGPDVLVILQTPLHLRDIERKYSKEMQPVFAPEDRIEALSPKKGVDPFAKFRDVLRRPTSAEYPETPFTEMAADFGKNNNIEVAIDRKALEAAAINGMTPVTVSLKNLPFESVLTIITDGLGIAWTIDGEKLLFTTPKQTRRMTVIYDVRDLPTGLDEEYLAKVLRRTVQPASWEDGGGPGKINAADDELSITQTVQVHRTIETWLADLRTALKPGGK